MASAHRREAERNGPPESAFGDSALRHGARIDPVAAWAAVVSRDARYDGSFVYAVATTRVYCRPSCGARRPKPDHVVFLDGPEAAEAAGYRACRRCGPRTLDRDRGVDAVERARTFIEAHLESPPALASLAAEVGVSPYHLQRTFTRVMGVSPRGYAAARRAERFKAQLRRGASVSRATYDTGYGSSSRAYAAASAHLGMTPAAYRSGGRGMQICYATTDSPFGRLLVGATRCGVCAVMLGEDEPELEASLRREYPHAKLDRDGDEIRGWIEATLQHLHGRTPRVAVPLDVQATAFQRRVWHALREIPFGETRSYSEIAECIGSPRAARAVARACATNPVALAIPCHRAVRGDGEVGGYRWGSERKRLLLSRERRAARAGGTAELVESRPDAKARRREIGRIVLS